MSCLTCDLANWIVKNGSWADLLYRKNRETPFGNLGVVQSKVNRDDINSYGEYDQGSTEKTFIVMELVKDGNSRFFRKEGTADSYDETVWDGTFREVFPKTKTVTVYDWE